MKIIYLVRGMIYIKDNILSETLDYKFGNKTFLIKEKAEAYTFTDKHVKNKMTIKKENIMQKIISLTNDYFG